MEGLAGGDSWIRPGNRKVAGETPIDRLIPLQPTPSRPKDASTANSAMGLHSIITREL
jgi:hypothetical protein